MSRRSVLAVAAAALLLPSVALAAPQATLAQARVGAATIEFAPQVDFAKAVLTVSAPGGQVHRFEGNGTVPSFGLFDAKGQPHPDGVYQWELRLAPRMTAELRKQLRAARARGEEGSVGELVQSGSFAIAGGAFVSPDEREAPVRSTVDKALTPTTAADQVIPDDLIVQQSLCVGFDCVNNESFGFDTIRLKENNTRIKFEDTSTGTFPTNDWQLTANDSASGGSSKFSIEDINGSKVPFTITAGASTNSIFVDSTGRVGFRTSTPVLDLHIATSNTPAIRLEQNNSGGFTAQTWDIGANEANFFVRDVTGGSKLSFRIRPGAPTSSLDISADGDIGIGTASPSAKLHISGSNGATKFIVTETSGTNAARTLFDLSNNGNTTFTLSDTGTNGAVWNIQNLSSSSVDGFVISRQGDGVNEFIIKDNGDVFINNGTVQVTSSRASKENFSTPDPEQLLATLSTLPITMWNYKKDGTSVRHMGPVAEDFYAAFGLGTDDKHVSHGDTSGVALAGVQALHSALQNRDARIAQLEAQLEALRLQVEKLAN